MECYIKKHFYSHDKNDDNRRHSKHNKQKTKQNKCLSQVFKNIPHCHDFFGNNILQVLKEKLQFLFDPFSKMGSGNLNVAKADHSCLLASLWGPDKWDDVLVSGDGPRGSLDTLQLACKYQIF